VGAYPLPGYGPVVFVNRPVRSRMQGGVGRGGEKPPLTRLVPPITESLHPSHATFMPVVPPGQ